MAEQPRSQQTTDVPFDRVAVVGAGVMGSGIAQTFAVAGLKTTCIDVDEGVLEGARHQVAGGRYGLTRAHERGYLQQPVDEVMSRLTFTTDLRSAVDRCDLVVESIPENIGSKVKLFRQLDSMVGPSCVLASNTSGFPISALAHATDRPGLVVGWHWASPPVLMSFAEIVFHDDSDDNVLRKVKDLATACGKRPVLVKDQPHAWGFVANRVYFAMVSEAKRVVSEGVVTAQELDQLMVDCFSWPVGPFGMTRGAQSGWDA